MFISNALAVYMYCKSLLCTFRIIIIIIPLGQVDQGCLGFGSLTVASEGKVDEVPGALKADWDSR